MTLPNDFVFTQHNLQDFEDCPRRFELRHLLHLAWPAPQTEPILAHERHMQMGDTFHRLVQQYFLGLPSALLTAQTLDPELMDWFSAFLEDPFVAGLPVQRWPEISLTMPFSGFRLLCKLDLLCSDEKHNFSILDWKTGTSPISRSILQDRWQTRLYPFILQHAATSLTNALPLRPDQIEMVYWFVVDPFHPQPFRFSQDQSVEVEQLLSQRISEIDHTHPDHFFMTTDVRRCAFCNYRSLCDRGETGNLANADADFEPPETTADLELDQIGEISI